MMKGRPVQDSEPLALASSLYSPLDEELDEIRLVTIAPNQLDGPLLCTLHKLTLEDIREEYSVFKTSVDEAGKPARNITVQWAQTHPMQHRTQLNNPEQPTVSSPSVTSSRFNWGDFAALSYVWGDEQDRRNILLNGTVFSVTTSLEIALRALSAKNEFQDDYKIWIDAICINQNDAIERASQVSKMREIYSGAWSVIAWLGESDKAGDTQKAFHFLRRMASLRPEEQDLARIMTEKPSFIEESFFFALHEMMTRTYWSRLWVIQEVVMGASSTVLRCGANSLEWETFCAGIAVLYNGKNWNLKDHLLRKERVHRNLSDDQGWLTTSLHLVHQDLRLLVRYEGEGGDKLNLRRLLEIASSASCRDVRDKVFALVGMMEPGIAHEVVHNYNFDIPRLFAAVTKAFILHYDNLEPLRQANPWGKQGAPTWAADWTWKGRMRWSRPESDFAGPLVNSLDPDPKPESIYNAHSGIPACYSFLEDNLNILQCDGFLLDEIAGLGAPEYGYFDWSKERLVQCASWRSSYGDQEATASALYKALLGGRTIKGKKVEDRHSALLSLPSTFRAAFSQFKRRGWSWLAGQEGYYFKWQRWRHANDNLMLGTRPLKSYFTDVLPKDAEEVTYMEVYSTACRMVMERRFMLTKNGYLGWAPDNAYESSEMNQARVGDVIAIIHGCSTPLVIRPYGSKFQVVGEAYVEGFMDGEAMDILRHSNCQPKMFDFC
ncbi:HET-domain-containing protein [Amniculicola lignicola CBS 123094]|uniref:HET-domain-containing protein n=1 Tax=Amniculicola lignicola CBS 123094 TaxID=1392246 RepID=A0A6A5WB15_9PLEO|nr:HET-domain-containing protein [Amniculicola lignicola CBS 123094]